MQCQILCQCQYFSVKKAATRDFWYPMLFNFSTLTMTRVSYLILNSVYFKHTYVKKYTKRFLLISATKYSICRASASPKKNYISFSFVTNDGASSLSFRAIVQLTRSAIILKYRKWIEPSFVYISFAGDKHTDNTFV